MRVSAPCGDEEKNIKRRALRDRRAFSPQRLKTTIILWVFHPLCVLPDLCGLRLFHDLGKEKLSSRVSFAEDEKKKIEEKAESAESIP
jgi:hypothetical protein